ncbi:Mitochondrial uncoupling protein 1 [Diplonema papillatum]|nr:Mitochondrial uncoupling protein 1 [Diplonema papillatum]
MNSDLSVGQQVLSGGCAGSLAEFCTVPIDVAKLRLQTQAGSKYKGVYNTMRTIAKEEGTTRLWRGVVPGMQRHFLCAGLRIGLYVPIRDFWTPATHVGPPSLLTKSLAAFTAGFVAMTVVNGPDVVRTRMQQSGSATKYPTVTRAYLTILKEEGIRGFYTGYWPNALRNGVMNVFEVGMYDQAKQVLLQSGYFDNGLPLHFTAAIIAAFTACVAASPLDVVKNRWITDAAHKYSSVANVVTTMYRTEGFKSFYLGFFPFFCRASSFIVVEFLAYEQVMHFLAARKSPPPASTSAA